MRPLVIAVSLLLACTTHADPKSVATSSERCGAGSEPISAKVSPTGKYLATLHCIDNKRSVTVYRRPEYVAINIVEFPDRSEVDSFWWVNEDRLLLSIAVNWQRHETPTSYGELYAVNADGTRGKYLFGLRANQTVYPGSRTSRVHASLQGAEPTNLNWADPKKIHVRFSDWNRGKDAITYYGYMDVYSGRITRKNSSPHMDNRRLDMISAQPPYCVDFKKGGRDSDQEAAIVEEIEATVPNRHVCIVSTTLTSDVSVIGIWEEDNTLSLFIYDQDIGRPRQLTKLLSAQ